MDCVYKLSQESLVTFTDMYWSVFGRARNSLIGFPSESLIFGVRPERFAHNQSLISSERPERFAHSRDLSKSLTVAHLIRAK